MAAFKQQLVIVWRVYEPCNLGCDFCGYSKNMVRKRHITDVDDILRFGEILAEFQKRTGSEVLVSWLGGEPLLWKKLPDISQKYNHDFGIKLGITTNGTLLDDVVVRSMLRNDYSLVTLSVDGFAQFHDLYRGENGLFEKIKNNAKSLIREIESSNSLLKLRVNTILMRENIHAFEEFCMEVADWGIRELTFNQLGGIDRPEFFPDHRLLPEQTDWLAKEFFRIKQAALLRGLTIFGGQPYLDRFVAASRDIAIPVDDCAPGRNFLFINEENFVSPCNFTTAGYGIPLSEVQDVEALIGLHQRFYYKQQHERVAPCDDCHSTQIFEKFNHSHTFRQ